MQSFFVNHWEEIVGAVTVIAASLFFIVPFSGRTNALSRQILELTKLLKELLAGKKVVDQEALERMDQCFEKSPVFRHLWFEFRETLVFHPIPQNGAGYTIFATRSIEDYFDKETILSEHTAINFYRQVPGLITSIGLILTFTFIVLGLYSLRGASGEIDLNELIKHLGGKFVSSITALVFSIVFSYLEHAKERKCSTALDQLLELLDHKFSHITPEFYLTSMDRRLEELNGTMQPFGTSLANLVSNGVQEGMKLSTSEIVAAVNALQKEKHESQTESLKGLLDEFKRSLSSSATTEFSELQKTVVSLSATLSASANSSAQLTELN